MGVDVPLLIPVDEGRFKILAFNLSILSEHCIGCISATALDLLLDRYVQRHVQAGTADGIELPGRIRIDSYLRSRMNEEYGTIPRYLYLSYLKSNASPYSQDALE